MAQKKPKKPQKAKRAKNKNSYPDTYTEIRQDIVTQEWVAISPKRKLRKKEDYKKKNSHKINKSKRHCPFEDPQKSGNGDPVLLYKDSGSKDKDWSLQIIPNKYPIFDHGSTCGVESEHGPYKIREGSGKHEVIITRDHHKHLALLGKKEAFEVARAYRERFLELRKDNCIKYISIFHNHGPNAGASLYHPHSQLAAMPVVPMDIHRSVLNSKRYEEENNSCVHCDVLEWEMTEKERILLENDDFVAFCPYVSHVNFEIEIFPKKHSGKFEEIKDEELLNFSEILRGSLNLMYKSMGNPDYNFFIHTAPADNGDYDYYHWHVEIFPKTETWAGIELGTGMEVLIVSPEDAARMLKEDNVE